MYMRTWLDCKGKRTYKVYFILIFSGQEQGYPQGNQVQISCYELKTVRCHTWSKEFLDRRPFWFVCFEFLHFTVLIHIWRTKYENTVNFNFPCSRFYQAVRAWYSSESHVYMVQISTGKSYCLSCNYQKPCSYASAQFSKSFTYYTLICKGPGVPYAQVHYTYAVSNLGTWYIHMVFSNNFFES